MPNSDRLMNILNGFYIIMSSEKLKHKKMEPIYVKSVSQKGFTSMENNSKKDTYIIWPF